MRWERRDVGHDIVRYTKLMWAHLSPVVRRLDLRFADSRNVNVFVIDQSRASVQRRIQIGPRGRYRGGGGSVGGRAIRGSGGGRQAATLPPSLTPPTTAEYSAG